MKFNPVGAAVVICMLFAAIAYAPVSGVKKVKRVNWTLVAILITALVLLLWDAKVRAQDIQYCISMERGNKVVMQCQNGTVTVVDNINDKVVVCSTGHNDSPRCQTLPLKDDK